MRKLFLLSAIITLNAFVGMQAMDAPALSQKQISQCLDNTWNNDQDIDWIAIFECLQRARSTFDVNSYIIPTTGSTLLGAAIADNDVGAAKILLTKYRANPHPKGYNFPLLLALWQKNLPMVELLVKHGADPYAKNQRGKDAFYYVQQQENYLGRKLPFSEEEAHQFMDALNSYKRP